MFDKAPVVTFVSVVNQVMCESVIDAHPRLHTITGKKKFCSVPGHIMATSWTPESPYLRVGLISEAGLTSKGKLLL